MTNKKRIPIKEGLFEQREGGLHLLGSRCRQCGEVTFPANSFCPQCCEETTETIPLSSQGILYSFTIQRFRPPPPYRGPEPFAPYGVGMIELPEGVRITSVLEESDPARLRVGMGMELVVAGLFDDEQGNEVLIYKFKPVVPIADCGRRHAPNWIADCAAPGASATEPRTNHESPITNHELL
jgi:uncharacterized OB-fold protein